MRSRGATIKERLARLAEAVGQVTIMEVCGTHTANIRRFGIPDLLPDSIRLISGPGCPVCVTPQQDIAAALSLAERKGIIFTSFGDMMRVPCGERSLYSLYEQGKDLRIVTSPLDALRMARENPQAQVVYFGIGFETTAPLTAALVEAADECGVHNLSVLSVHKTVPQALRQLLKSGSKIDALLCPGHVAAIIGARGFSFVPDQLMLPAVVAGFEADDIVAALFGIIQLLRKGETRCVNMYPRAVTEDGNREALLLLDRVFEPCDARWRGLGEIEGSGLRLKGRYKQFDATLRFEIKADEIEEAKNCICGRILCGEGIPADCLNFGTACTPDRPLGACMVSAEGTCAAHYRYGGDNNGCKGE